MSRFYQNFVLGMLLLGAASAGAAEYRFTFLESGWLIGMKMDLSSTNPADSTHRYTFAPDSLVPADVILVLYPVVTGTDSVDWRSPHYGVGMRGRLSGNVPSLLSRMLADGNSGPADTILFQGVPRLLRRSHTSSYGDPPDFTSIETLSGIGTLYFQEAYHQMSSQSHRNSWFNLRRYNGMDIDSLRLTFPVSLAPGKRAQRPGLRARRFDLHEMGVFLGRKSVLAAPLP